MFWWKESGQASMFHIFNFFNISFLTSGTALYLNEKNAAMVIYCHFYTQKYAIFLEADLIDSKATNWKQEIVFFTFLPRSGGCTIKLPHCKRHFIYSEFELSQPRMAGLVSKCSPDCASRPLLSSFFYNPSKSHNYLEMCVFETVKLRTST